MRRSKLDREEAARFLAQFLALVIEAAFQQVRGDDRVRRQIELANRIIRGLAEELEQVELTGNLIEDEGLILEAVFRELKAQYPGHARLDIRIVDRDAVPAFSDDDFEPLLSLAALARERKTGEEFDYAAPVSYETGGE